MHSQINIQQVYIPIVPDVPEVYILTYLTTNGVFRIGIGNRAITSQTEWNGMDMTMTMTTTPDPTG